DGTTVYGMTQYGGIVRNNNALIASPSSTNTAYICSGITDASCNFNNSAPKILFIPPLKIDPNNNNTLYLRAANLWRSINIKNATATAVAWASVKAPLSPVSYISTIAVASGNSDLIWVGYANGQLACTTNGTAAAPTWTVVTGGVARYVTRINFDFTNP